MLGDVVSDFATGTYAVQRRSAPTFVKGIAQPASATTLNIEMMVAPLTGRELERLPEGERANERRLLLSTTELKTASDSFSADIVTIAGETYEVETVENWLELAGFWKCIARKEGR